MLAIEVEYLLGRVHAAEFRNSAKPEWPPHPARLFSALVAAHHDTEGSAEERETLLWLERQTPPEISASEPGRPNEVVTFVPTNYAGRTGSTHPEQRTKQPRSFPAQGPASPMVYYVWPEAEPSARQTDALTRLASRVSALGRACSLVRVRISGADELGEFVKPNYVPSDRGTIVLAVPGEGRLADLERSYQFGRRPEQGTPARYLNLNGERLVAVPDQGHFGEMIVLRRISGISFPSEATTLLTRRLRKVFLSKAGEGSELSPTLSGHEDERPATSPHVAFAALPNVGGGFGDGKLMGLAVVLPRSISRADRRIALRACASIESINLGADLGEWQVEIANFDVPQRTLKTESWMRGSKKWATVTPVLLDRYPKKGTATEELLVMACLRAGLPVPVRCLYGPHVQGELGALKGVPPVFAFSNERWAVHAAVEFEREVKGPVLIGAGRFFGMGLFKPVGYKSEPGTE